MFRFFASSAAPAGRRRSLRRAAWCGGALVLVWLALRLMPAPTPPATTPAVYSDAAGTVAVDAAEPPSSSATLTPGVLAALALLAGGIGLAVYLRQRSGPAGPAAAFIEPLETCALAPGQQLRLVRCGGEVLLLGVASGQITLLKTFGEEEFPAAEQPPSEIKTTGGSFAALLRQHAGLASITQPARAA